MEPRIEITKLSARNPQILNEYKQGCDYKIYPDKVLALDRIIKNPHKVTLHERFSLIEKGCWMEIRMPYDKNNRIVKLIRYISSSKENGHNWNKNMSEFMGNGDQKVSKFNQWKKELGDNGVIWRNFGGDDENEDNLQSIYLHY
uniref:Type II toxin-antitoxin system RelE/ParE family toxin n=1 Tax=Heterorhabditis bacteriophora TaxID=37862 RepID=A0A1I7XAA1_HETBA